jgi:site-specific recombinase XerD
MATTINPLTSLPSFTTYIEDRKYLKNVSPKTLAWLSDAWRPFRPHLEPVLSGGGRLNDGLRAAISALLEKGVKPVSINSYLTCVRAYLNWLHAEGHLPDKPRVPLLKYEQKVITTFSPEQIRKLVSLKPKGANQTRVHVASCLMLDTGLRLQEVLSLTPADVDFDNLLVKVTGKGNKQRLVPVSADMRRTLYRYSMKVRGPLVFGTRNGTKVTNRNLERDFKLLCTRVGIAGVRCSPHTLRHTFAVAYLRAGGNLFYLSRILGHTSIKTTERYLQSVQVEDLQAVHDRLSPLAPDQGRSRK